MQIKNFFLKVAQKFLRLPTSFKFYAAGYSSAGGGLVIALLGIKALSLFALTLLGLCFVLIAIGFAWWLTPFTKKAWSSTPGKTVITVAHIFVLLISTVFSRNLVASATGLPPHDFDLAVSALALIYYIPIWTLIASALILVTGTIFIAGDMLRSSIPIPRSKSANERGAHASGATVFAILVVFLIQLLVPSSGTQATLALRLIYATEYFQATKYPGVLPFEHIRLHDNGIVSSAALTKDGVVITVRQWSAPPQSEKNR